MVSLRDIFPHVAVKRLAAVDIAGRGSNQHELNGVASLREFFGTGERLQLPITFHLYRDDEASQHDTSAVTFYDSRANQPKRSPEWRLYYQGDFLSRAIPGDVLILARTKEGELHGFVFAQDSGWLAAAETLFGASGESDFFVVPTDRLVDSSVELAERRIIEELGIDLAFPIAPDYMRVAQHLLERNKGRFPSTREMGLEARGLVRVDVSDPDAALCFWLDAEEQLFYAMESELLAGQLERKFETVDEFIQVAQSVLQRRKSRMGYSLQNHTAEIFRILGLRFTPQARTERKNQPDFLLPGQEEYRDASWPAERLTMLAAKSTCKDRWRQILTEADRITNKHLLTLDQALSTDQVAEMAQSHVTIVLPRPLQRTYHDSLRRQFLTVADFTELARERQ